MDIGGRNVQYLAELKLRRSDEPKEMKWTLSCVKKKFNRACSKMFELQRKNQEWLTITETNRKLRLKQAKHLHETENKLKQQNQ